MLPRTKGTCDDDRDIGLGNIDPFVQHPCAADGAYLVVAEGRQDRLPFAACNVGGNDRNQRVGPEDVRVVGRGREEQGAISTMSSQELPDGTLFCAWKRRQGTGAAHSREDFTPRRHACDGANAGEPVGVGGRSQDLTAQPIEGRHVALVSFGLIRCEGNVDAHQVKASEVTTREIRNLELEHDGAQELAETLGSATARCGGRRRESQAEGSRAHLKGFGAHPSSEVVGLVHHEDPEPVAISVEASVGALKGHDRDALDVLHAVTYGADGNPKVGTQQTAPLVEQDARGNKNERR